MMNILETYYEHTSGMCVSIESSSPVAVRKVTLKKTILRLVVNVILNDPFPHGRNLVTEDFCEKSGKTEEFSHYIREEIFL